MSALKACVVPAAALGALFVAACGGEPQFAGTITDSAGVALVANTDVGLWTDEVAWTLEEEVRIGSVEEEPEYQFGQVGGLAVGSDGRMYVVDAQAQHIKVFSAEGEYERTIAGPGGGPGELGQGAVFVSVMAGDTLFVPDIGNVRLNRYAPDGTALASIPYEISEGIPLQWRATPDNLLAVQRRPLTTPDATPDSMDTIVLLDAEGTVTDTLIRIKSGTPIGAAERKIFAREPIWTVTGDNRLLHGFTDDYQISVHGRDGSLERIITYPFERKSVTDSDQQAYMDIIADLLRELGVPQTQAQQFMSIVTFGETYPAFVGIQDGPRGTIWVQHFLAVSDITEEQRENFNPLEDTGAPDWDVFDRDGRYLGVVTMPNRFTPRAVLDDRIYGVWRDELDVQYVMRLRIVGAEID